MIGIDIGRVIISGDTDIPNQFFGEDYLTVPAVKEAFNSIKKIVEKYSSENVFLVSKCGEKVQARTLEWLAHHNFYSETGISQKNIKFCRERHEKKEICEAYKIKIFIDDRFTVLQHLVELDQLYLFAPSQKELNGFNSSKYKEKIRLVNGWKEIRKELIR